MATVNDSLDKKKSVAKPNSYLPLLTPVGFHIKFAHEIIGTQRSDNRYKTMTFCGNKITTYP